MKKSRFSEEQIIGILREGESGSSVKAVSAKHNISEATYYAWKRKYGGLEVERGEEEEGHGGGDREIEAAGSGPVGAKPDP